MSVPKFVVSSKTISDSLIEVTKNVLKVCTGFIGYAISFENLHKMCKRATPEQMMKYKLSLCLFKLYNSNFNSIEFVLLNFNQALTGRQVNFKTLKSHTHALHHTNVDW